MGTLTGTLQRKSSGCINFILITICRIYTRDSAQVMATYGASIQSGATGVPVTEFPVFNKVMLRDGTQVTPRCVLTTTETGQGLVSVMEADVVDSVIPSRIDVTQGRCIVHFMMKTLTFAL